MNKYICTDCGVPCYSEGNWESLLNHNCQQRDCGGVIVPEVVKAITLWQPWATLKALDVKRYEPRSWATSYRGAMAIHAAARAPKDGIAAFNDIESLDELLNALCGVGIVPRHMPLDAAVNWICSPGILPTAEVIGIGNLVDCHLIDAAFIAKLSPREKLFGDFTPGRYAWEFKDMHKFKTPIPVRGQQGIWDWKIQRGGVSNAN